MKKAALCIMLALCLITMVGCKEKKEFNIDINTVKTNTVLIRDNGSVQAATVELFEKSHYNINELSDFITSEIIDFNKSYGEGAVSIGGLEVIGEDVILILNYTSIDSYNKYKELIESDKVDVSLTSAEAARNGDITLPQVLISATNGSYITKDEAIKNNKYNVIKITENTDLYVDGTIKFYDNAVLIDNTKLQTGAEGETVIVYKP